MQVTVEFYCPEWRKEFEKALFVLQKIFGRNALAIHHIGSTSIPGIYAKPVIDILIEAENIDAVDKHNVEMKKSGYEAMGEFGITGRRYFRKDNESAIRTHHVHVFLVGTPEVKRHLAFRDFMIAHPEWAQRYSRLKLELVQKYPDSIEDYMDGKDSFIKEVDKLAISGTINLMSNKPSRLG